MGWAIPDVSGLVLLNRLRRHPAYELTPVLIVSSRLLPTDFRLLQELACVEHLPEPFERGALGRALNRVAIDAQWYRTNVPLVDAVLEMAQTDGARAVALLREGIARAPNPVPLGVVAARALRRSGFAREAEDVLRHLVARDAGCLVAISELGKALYAQGRSADAMEKLREAHKMSPHNIARLCLIGEVELSLERAEAAQRSFRAALDVDGADPVAKLGLDVAGRSPRLRPAGGDDVNLFFAGILNGKGIAHVRAGRFEEGIAAYHAACAVLLKRDVAARVLFNIGLAYLRWRKPIDAMPWFGRSLDYSDGTFAKARRYIERGSTDLVGYDIIAEAPDAPVDDGPIDDTPLDELVEDDPDLLEESIGSVLKA